MDIGETTESVEQVESGDADFPVGMVANPVRTRI